MFSRSTTTDLGNDRSAQKRHRRSLRGSRGVGRSERFQFDPIDSKSSDLTVSCICQDRARKSVELCTSNEGSHPCVTVWMSVLHHMRYR